MSDLELVPGLFASVTPAGAFRAVTDPGDSPPRRVLLGLLGEARTSALTTARVCAWSGDPDPASALDLLQRMQAVGWLSAETAARDVPGTRMDDELPALLAQLSDRRTAMLADAEGFHLSSVGFTHEAAEQVAALAAELAGIHRRYASLLRGNLRLDAAGLSIVDAAGFSQLAVWPLVFRDQTFLLVVAGVPMLDRRAFADAVWGLVHRYATPPSIDDGRSPSNHGRTLP